MTISFEMTPEIIAALPDPLLLAEIMRKVRRGMKPGFLLKDKLQYPPETMEKLYNVAHSFYEKGKFLQAEEVFEELYQLDPIDYRIAFGLGATAHQLRSWYKAVAYYAAASENDPKAPEPLYFSGECCLQMGKESQAIKLYREAAALCNEEAKYQDLKNRCLALAGSLEERAKQHKPPLCLEAKNRTKSAS